MAGPTAGSAADSGHPVAVNRRDRRLGRCCRDLRFHHGHQSPRSRRFIAIGDPEPAAEAAADIPEYDFQAGGGVLDAWGGEDVAELGEQADAGEAAADGEGLGAGGGEELAEWDGADEGRAAGGRLGHDQRPWQDR